MTTQHLGNTPRWPIYLIDGCHHAANLYLLPGIQAPDLVQSDGTISCSITNTREALGVCRE